MVAWESLTANKEGGGRGAAVADWSAAGEGRGDLSARRPAGGETPTLQAAISERYASALSTCTRVC